MTRVLGWAEEDYDMFVAKPLAAEPDPALTKGYFQWSAMSWFALADAGFAPEVWGRRLVEQALWMVDVHRTLTRTRNTGYAYEGIVPAWSGPAARATMTLRGDWPVLSIRACASCAHGSLDTRWLQQRCAQLRSGSTGRCKTIGVSQRYGSTSPSTSFTR
ncbi:hypothetical protein [Mycolicibacterium monacense]|uniref:hypothetical protein n=1 Tax=Mycolicibacterium monacense TaxID=85693 RepID=UPI0013D0695E|nr:hypothetical protein [Mycolicibacterium monacense]